MKKKLLLIAISVVTCVSCAQKDTSDANGGYYISMVKQPSDTEAMAFELTEKLTDSNNKISFTVMPRLANTVGDIRFLPEDRRMSSRNDLVAGFRMQNGKFNVYNRNGWADADISWVAEETYAVEFVFNFAEGNYRVSVNGTQLPEIYMFRALQAKPNLSHENVFRPQDNIGIMGVACADGAFDIRSISSSINNLVDNDALKNLKETNPVIGAGGDKTYLVGPTRKYQKAQDVVLDLNPGDAVWIDAFEGDYPAPLYLATINGESGRPITFKGLRANGKRPVIRSAGASHPVSVISKYIVLEGIAFEGHIERALAVRGKTIADLRKYYADGKPGERGPNDSPYFISSDAISYRGVRLDGADHLIIRDCEIYYNYHGIQGMHGNITVEYCDVHSNAISNQSHNFYLHSDPGTVARIQYNYIHEPFFPMNGLKTRAGRNEVYYNYFYNNGQAMELISNNTATHATPFDSDVVGNVIVVTNPTCTQGMRMSGDGTGPGTYGRYRVANNTFAFLHARHPYMLRLCTSQWVESVEVYNNVFYSACNEVFSLFSTPTQGTWVAGGRVIGANNWMGDKVDRSSIPGTEAFKEHGWDPGIYEFKGTIYGENPGFVNSKGEPFTGLDLSIRAGSPLIGAGVPMDTFKEWPAFEGGRSPFIFPNPLTVLDYQPVNPAVTGANGRYDVAGRSEKKNPDIGAYGTTP